MRSLILGMLLILGFLTSTARTQESVQIVLPRASDGPAAYGIRKLSEAILGRNIAVNSIHRIEQAGSSHVIVMGLASEQPVAKLITAGGLALPEQPQSLAIRCIEKGGRSTVVLCGGDEVGLMYAALDTAERIGWATSDEDLFAHLRDTSESPCLKDRSVSTYTMQRRLFEQRLYDEAYWKHYFDMLAKDRINSYVIIFGYENGGFMAPPYPYFFDVEEFPQVKLYGMSMEEQAKNAAALNRVIELANERGIRFIVGIWDHIYRGGVQGGGIAGASDLAGTKAPHLVYGVTSENLAPYTKAALKKFLTVFPNISGIQFRMHGESGLKRSEMPRFWHEVFSMLTELQPDLRFDLRAKGLPDEIIEDAVAQGLPFRIGTKYWMEQLGLPFHPTHVNPQEPEGPSSRLCRFVEVSQEVRHALADLERRHGTVPVVGRPRLRAAFRRKCSGLRRQQF